MQYLQPGAREDHRLASVYALPFERSRLLRGAIVATIAYGVFLVSDGSLSHELSWDGSQYNRQDSQGTRGTVSFVGDRIVAAFFDEKSPSSPYRMSTNYDYHSFLQGMPPDLQGIAERTTLQYLLEDYGNRSLPIITAAFWGDGGNLVAAHPWQDVYANGAHILKNEILSLDDAIEAWSEDFELSPPRADLFHALAYRSAYRSHEKIRLTVEELQILASEGDIGIEAARVLLSHVDIILP